MVVMILAGCRMQQDRLQVEIFETSAQGHKLTRMKSFPENTDSITIRLLPEQQFQTITGFGGSFTESSAWLLNQISRKNRDSILKAYFGNNGARYSLTRTHINSCDFSLNHYSYASVSGDTELKHFSIDHDRVDIIPMIKDAIAISDEGFKIIASPWTAPPWMKDNNKWEGGKLLPQYYDTWALFLSKYIKAYAKEGINIWGITVENEPLGNGNNWESMLYTPGEIVDFVKNHLGSQLKTDGLQTKILAYDQNRGEELTHWAEIIYGDKAAADFLDGFAIHWYASTYNWFPKSLNVTHYLSPNKHLIQTEACVDAEVPHWKDDSWYWSKEATDWGWDWAPEDQKSLHPKYVPVYRYARDIIGCLNNWVDGWVDWNMVLDRQGGPNWAMNWCTAPVLVDPNKDDVYFTPLYYTLAHFSKFIRPGASRIGFENPDDSLLMTAARNPDGSIVMVILNMQDMPKVFNIRLEDEAAGLKISPRAIQTIVFPSSNNEL